MSKKNRIIFTHTCIACDKTFTDTIKYNRFCKICRIRLTKAQRNVYIQQHKVKKPDPKAQLCWTCAHTNAIDCPWFELPPTLNPNSTVKKTELGYHITACKDYEPDRRHKI